MWFFLPMCSSFVAANMLFYHTEWEASKQARKKNREIIFSFLLLSLIWLLKRWWFNFYIREEMWDQEMRFTFTHLYVISLWFDISTSTTSSYNLIDNLCKKRRRRRRKKFANRFFLCYLGRYKQIIIYRIYL